MRSSNDHNKVIMLEGQEDEPGEEVNEETTMTIGTLNMTRVFVHLPEELLPMILDNLERKSDLLVCRQVNSTWNDHSSKILRQQDNLQIHLRGRSLVSRLNECLERSNDTSFPCAQFKFSEVSLEDKSLQNFFDRHGSSIRSLSLCDFKTKIDHGHLKSMKRLLVNQAPNIKHLRMDHLRIIPAASSASIQFDDGDQIRLTNLQTLDHGVLKYAEEKKLMEKIIVAAPYLKVYKISLGPQGLLPLEVLESSGKLYSLKKISFFICDTNIELCEKLVNFPIQLESVCFTVLDIQDKVYLQRAVFVMNKILDFSKDTLINFDPFYYLGWIPGLIFPVLKKVTKLCVTEYGFHGNDGIFPIGLNLSTVFPNVRKVYLESLPASTVDFWDTCFPFDDHENSWPSVETLKINSPYQDFIPNLSRLFPNLKSLIVDGRRVNFSTICRKIFGYMSGLQNLEFLQMNCSLPENRYPALDSVLTGFSLETCVRLAGETGEILDVEEVQKLRENLSILELTGLKIFKIVISSGGPTIISQVSRIWAFQQMPHLMVILTEQ